MRRGSTMSTVDHRSGVHNPDGAHRSPAPPRHGHYVPFLPCRAIGGAVLPVPMQTTTAYEPNEESPDPDFVVGVVDTGLVLNGDGRPHPWLEGHVVFDSTDDNDPLPDNGELRADDGHGTFVAGIILREAPRVLVRTIRGFDRNTFANPDQPTEEELTAADVNVAGAILRLLDPNETLSRPSKIINLSFYGVFPDESRPTRIRDAIQAASDQGVVVIVAAGNDPRRSHVWPAAFAEQDAIRNMHVVGAVDESLCRSREHPPFIATFSNRQEWVRTYANGVYVNGPLYSGDLTYAPVGPVHDYFLPAKSPVTLSSTPAVFRGWAKWSGTSFAAATVSGILAQQAMENPGSAVADIADQVLKPNIRIDGAGAPDQLVCYLRGVDSDWPASSSTTPSHWDEGTSREA